MSPFTLRRASACLAAFALTVAVVAAADTRSDSRGLAQAAPAAQETLPPNDDFQSQLRLFDRCNDAYSECTDVLPFNHEQSTAGFTLEEGETAPCAPIGATAWFAYDADRDGKLYLDTRGSDFNTVLAVYTYGGSFIPSPPGANLVNVECDTSVGGTSSMEIDIVRGRAYLIQAGGRDGASGSLKLLAECRGCTAPNDEQFTADGISVDAFRPSFTYRQSTEGATLAPGEPQPCGGIGATVWYEFYGDFDATIEVDTVGSDFDTVVAIYREDPEGGPPGELLACNDNGAGAQSRLSFQTQIGRYVRLQIGGAGGDSGSLVVNMRCAPICPPYNDNFSRYNYAEPPIDETVQTLGATLERGEPRPCGNIGATVWVWVDTFGAGGLRVSTEGSDFDPVVALYDQPVPAYDPVTGSPALGGLRELACDAGTAGSPATLRWDAQPRYGYLLQLGGRNGQSGTLRWTLECDPGPCPPYNDQRDYATGLGAPYLDYRETLDTRGATEEPTEQLDCGDMGNTVWYVIYPNNIDHPVIIDTAGSDFDTAIRVYDGNFGVDNQSNTIACAAGSAGQRASLRFEMSGTVSYFVQVGGRNGASGNLQLSIDCDGPCPPPNDNTGAARQLYPGSIDIVDTANASTEAGETQPCGNIGKTVWYTLFSPDATSVRLSTEGSAFPTVMALYSFEGFSPPGGATNIACTTGGALDVELRDGFTYLLQVGGIDGAGGMLRIESICTGTCPRNPPPGDIGVPTDGSGRGGGGAGVSGPDTGNGGYLPRRQ